MDSAEGYHYERYGIAEFLAVMSEAGPAPAAGSAAANVAALAASLISKAAKLSVKHLPRSDDLDRRAILLRDRAMELCNEDPEHYAKVIEARRKQRDEDDPTTELPALALALSLANRVPYELAELAAELSALAAEIAVTGNPNLIGDCISAAILAQSVVNIASVLTEINVPDPSSHSSATELKELYSTVSNHVTSALASLARRSATTNQQR
ncbi:MAG: cyclodeaminase/cyclohydrolase family protein [Acidimicrobiales bacterium]